MLAMLLLLLTLLFMLFFVWSVNQRVKLSGMHTLIIVRGVGTGGGRGAGAPIKFRASISSDLQAPGNAHNYMHVSTHACTRWCPPPPHEKTSYATDNVGSHTYTHVHVHMILYRL